MSREPQSGKYSNRAREAHQAVPGSPATGLTWMSLAEGPDQVQPPDVRVHSGTVLLLPYTGLHAPDAKQFDVVASWACAR